MIENTATMSERFLSIFAKLTHFNYNRMLDAPFSRFIVFVFCLQQISKSFTN